MTTLILNGQDVCSVDNFRFVPGVRRNLGNGVMGLRSSDTCSFSVGMEANRAVLSGDNLKLRLDDGTVRELLIHAARVNSQVGPVLMVSGILQ